MITRITSEPDGFATTLRKIWTFRMLIVVFAKRDLKVKYAQTYLGVAWSLFQPLVALIIYTVFFEVVMNVGVAELPYTVHVLSGLMGWNYFTNLFISGSNSIQESSSLIKKVYFPKVILPLSKVIVASVEMFFSAVILIPLMIYFSIPVSIHAVFMPFVWLYNTLCALMLVYWLGVLAIRKRDLYHILPFIVYFGIWLTPVFFSVDHVPDQLRFVLDHNPMANVLELWRWSLFESGELEPVYAINFVVITVLCSLGLYFFSRSEGELSDFA